MISSNVMQELEAVRQVLHYLPSCPKTDAGWSMEEQERFWEAITHFPYGPWTSIAAYIGTKTTRQAMTHGQKLRQKLCRWKKRLCRRAPTTDPDAHEDEEATANKPLPLMQLPTSSQRFTPFHSAQLRSDYQYVHPSRPSIEMYYSPDATLLDSEVKVDTLTAFPPYATPSVMWSATDLPAVDCHHLAMRFLAQDIITPTSTEMVPTFLAAYECVAAFF